MDEFDLHIEPQYHFTPLSPDKYCELYDVEMASFTEDLPFYLQHSHPEGNTLELGCGTGRLTRELARTGHRLTAVDISFPMVQKAAATSLDNIRYVCGDMTNISFCHKFDTVIIPYNTLNLLRDSAQIANCFSFCHQVLKPHGRLLFQVFVPNSEMVLTGKKKLFQFKIFNTGEATRIIKETIKSYNSAQNKLVLEERYRIRTPGKTTLLREDYIHTFNLLGVDYQHWLALLREAGFIVLRLYGNYQLTEYVSGKSSSLLAVAEKKSAVFL